MTTNNTLRIFRIAPGSRAEAVNDLVEGKVVLPEEFEAYIAWDFAIIIFGHVENDTPVHVLLHGLNERGLAHTVVL